MAVVGEKAILKLDGTAAAVMATFVDGSPAVYKKEQGKGAAIVTAFPVGECLGHLALSDYFWAETD